MCCWSWWNKKPPKIKYNLLWTPILLEPLLKETPVVEPLQDDVHLCRSTAFSNILFHDSVIHHQIFSHPLMHAAVDSGRPS